MAKAVDNVTVKISVVLGRAVMPIHQLLKMDRGAVIELNATIHDRALLYANNRLIARSEVTVVDDHVATSITERVGSLED